MHKTQIRREPEKCVPTTNNLTEFERLQNTQIFPTGFQRYESTLCFGENKDYSSMRRINIHNNNIKKYKLINKMLLHTIINTCYLLQDSHFVCFCKRLHF